MPPLLMHHAYTNYGGGGSGNMQQIQAPPQQLHLQQHQLQQHWNNNTVQKRSKYHISDQKHSTISKSIKSNTAEIKKWNLFVRPISSHSTIRSLVKLLVSVSGFQWHLPVAVLSQMGGSFGILSLWFSNFSLLSTQLEKKVKETDVVIIYLWKNIYIRQSIYRATIRIY